MRIIFLLIAAATLLAGCSNRGGKLDELIRSEPSLVRLQRQVDWTLEAAEAGPELRREQERWRDGLTRCLDAEDPGLCVAEAHAERLSDLQERFGLTPRGVALHAAARDGFDFLARGNEPGWKLVTSQDRCVWETDYGRTRQEITGVEYDLDGDTHRYRATLEGEAWEARIEPEPCSDDMSGEEFPWRATIEWRGQKLRGCAEPTGR